MFKEYLERKAKEFLLGMGDNFKNEMKYKMYMYKRKIVKDFVSLFILLTAIAFISLALVFFFIEYLALTKTLSFLIIGIILILIGLIIKITG